MFVIANGTNNEMSTTTTMSVNTNLIPPAMRLFPTKRNARFKVLWPQLRSLEQQYPSPNLPTLDMEPLAQWEIMFVNRQCWLQKVLFYAQLAKATHLILTKRLEQQIQPHFEQLMKHLVCCLLDINILM